MVVALARAHGTRLIAPPSHTCTALHVTGNPQQSVSSSTERGLQQSWQTYPWLQPREHRRALLGKRAEPLQPVLRRQHLRAAGLRQRRGFREQPAPAQRALSAQQLECAATRCPHQGVYMDAGAHQAQHGGLITFCNNGPHCLTLDKQPCKAPKRGGPRHSVCFWRMIDLDVPVSPWVRSHQV